MAGKKKHIKQSFTSNLETIGARYGDLISILKTDMAVMVRDKRDPSKIVSKFNINDQFAYSYIVEEYFRKDPAKYKEEDKSPSTQRITANAIVMYLKGAYKKNETLPSPTSG